MEIKSQICTSIEQSKRLIALGLKKETADCRWIGLVKDAKGRDIPKKKQIWCLRASESEEAMVCGFMKHSFIPAWSLHRLIELLPQYIHLDDYADTHYCLTIDPLKIIYKNSHRLWIYQSDEGSLYDKLINTIEWTIKNNFFNKEYLI